MDADSENHTWLSTIVFTDIVEYSKRALDQQIGIKEHFNHLISDAIAGMEDDDRVILDTGDGVALCMLGDPEAAIVASLELRKQVMTPQTTAPEPYEIRTGINLGPVKLVTDINGRYNVLGDGINVAQRIMSFAHSSQMLVSRSFYDVAWCLSDEYSNLFQYLGIRRDKHGFEHVVYEVRSDDSPQATGTDTPAHPEPVFDEVTRIVRSRLAQEVAPLSTIKFEPEILRRVEYELLAHVGPLASLLVRKEAARAPSLEDLFVRLARAVPVGEARSAFLTRTKAVLNDFGETEPVSGPPTGIDFSSQPQAKPETSTGDWDEAVLEQAIAKLRSHIGPMAPMLVRKAARRTGKPRELYEMLAREIEDEGERQRFLDSAPRG